MYHLQSPLVPAGSFDRAQRRRGRRQVANALVAPEAVAGWDEVADLLLEVAGELVVLE